MKQQILFIDHEKENLIVFKHQLKEHYHVHVATSVEDGYKILNDKDIKLVVVDQAMPQLSGIEFLEQTRIHFPDVIRMVLAEQESMKVVADAVKKGTAYRFIPKPFDDTELKNTVDKALEFAELRAENAALRSKLEQAHLDLNQLTQELHHAKRKAEEFGKLKSAFLANLSHEFRTPLTAIYGSADLLNSSLTAQSLKPELLEIITYNSNKLIRQFNDVIEVSLLDSGQVKLQIELFDLKKMFDELKAFAENKMIHYDKEHLELYFSSDQNIEGRSILTDGPKLQRMFENLLDNAIKFTEDGYVKYGCKFMESNKIKFFVDDSGLGIDECHHPHIFDAFRKESQNEDKLYEGVGMGLTIFKGYLDLFGGEFMMKSSMEKGTYIRFTL